MSEPTQRERARELAAEFYASIGRTLWWVERDRLEELLHSYAGEVATARDRWWEERCADDQRSVRSDRAANLITDACDRAVKATEAEWREATARQHKKYCEIEDAYLNELKQREEAEWWASGWKRAARAWKASKALAWSWVEAARPLLLELEQERDAATARAEKAEAATEHLKKELAKESLAHETAQERYLMAGAATEAERSSFHAQIELWQTKAGEERIAREKAEGELRLLQARNAGLEKGQEEWREAFLAQREARELAEKERDDARNLAAAVALGITHSTVCSAETPCCRCERDQLVAEAASLSRAREVADQYQQATALAVQQRNWVRTQLELLVEWLREHEAKS